MWRRNQQGLYSDGQTVEGALKLIDARAERLGRIAKQAVKVVLLAAAVMAAVGQIWSGFTSSVDKHALGLGIVLVVVAAVAGVLQVVDWVWATAPIGKYRKLFDKLNTALTGHARRRGTARVLSRYGRQELARQHVPKEADRHSVATYLKRRRRYALEGVITVTAAVAALITVLSISPQSTPIYSVGQAITLDSRFSATVLGAPQCGVHDPEVDISFGPLCEVLARFRNISSYAYSVGDFTSIGPSSTRYLGEPYSYGVELISNDDNYDFINAIMTSGSYTDQAGQSDTFALYFTVPSGVHPDELEVQAETGAQFTIGLLRRS
jgi:hypothetical protein